MAYAMALLMFFQMVEIQHILFYGQDQTDSLQQMKILLDFVMGLTLSHFQILQQQFMIQYL